MPLDSSQGLGASYAQFDVSESIGDLGFDARIGLGMGEVCSMLVIRSYSASEDHDLESRRRLQLFAYVAA